MAKACDVCGTTLGFLGKFRYQKGYICKKCYGKASRQFTETIRNKSLTEIKVLCAVERDEESLRNFKVTGKIGNYLLVDDKQGKICLMNNRMTKQKVTEPEIYDVSHIQSCEIKYQPAMPMETLKQKVQEQKTEETIDFLQVELQFFDGTKKKIQLLNKKLRIKSFAFRQSFHFAERISNEIWRMMEQWKPLEEAK